MLDLEKLLAAGLSAQPNPLYSAAVGLVQRHGHRTHSAAVGHLARYADADGTPAPAELTAAAASLSTPPTDRLGAAAGIAAASLSTPPTDRLGAAAGITVDEATVFDFASITKMFTAVVLLTLVDQGQVGLDEPVAAHLESFGERERSRVTLRHLLTHTSGLPAVMPLPSDWPDRRSRIDAVLHAPLGHQPGAAFEYSCIGFMVAGLLAEKVTSTGLATLVRERVCEPLGLADTGYLPAADLVARSAATEYQPDMDRGMVRGSVHDESSWSLGGTAGNAGIFGTAGDLMRFGEMLRLGGAIGQTRILRSETVHEMTRDQLPPHLDPGYRHGLGTRIDDPQSMGGLAGSGAFGHTGFTGTSLVVDPSRGLVVVLLTNRVHPRREWSTIVHVRQAVADLAASE